ncbi:MAG: hypothetical protein IJQ55_00150 [Alphaproteobacteria bacterium]|nr:hypothetical protein [Alphaproteobacteria bacterium]
MTVKTKHTRYIQNEFNPNVENCNTLINAIGNFYGKHEHHITMQDSLKILNMLQTIEAQEKHLSDQERKSMYNNLKKMKRHYNEGR